MSISKKLDPAFALQKTSACLSEVFLAGAWGHLTHSALNRPRSYGGVYEPDENLYRVLHTVTFDLVNSLRISTLC